MKTLDIGAAIPGVAGRLSNFTRRLFVFEGVTCKSIEGLLQSLHYKDLHEQEEVCALSGMSAKRKGAAKGAEWQNTQTLWWKGVEYDRHSPAYQMLLSRAYKTVYQQDDRFRRDLFKVRGYTLTHRVGGVNPERTILTEKEFCDLLTTLRDRGAL